MYLCIHQKDTSYRHRNLCNSINLYPDTQCIVFLPAFGEFFYGKLVNIQVTLNFWDIFFSLHRFRCFCIFVYIHTLIRLMVHKIRRSPVDMENIPWFTWGFSRKDRKFAGFLKHQQSLYHLHLPGSWKKPVHLSVFFHRERLQVASPRCPCGKVDERLGASAFLRSATKVWVSLQGTSPYTLED